MVPMTTPTDDDYRRLLELRTGLRRFLRWSERQAETAGLTPAQHQLLLAIRGHADPRGPTVGDVADSLLLRHHSVVGLVDRAAAAGLVERGPDPGDRRGVIITLTEAGHELIDRVTEAHMANEARLLDGLGAREREQLADLLRKLGLSLPPLP